MYVGSEKITLKEYYKRAVLTNDTFAGGWARDYYGIWSEVINKNNYKNIAEVGIGYGTHAKYVLNTTEVEKIHLIDPMRYYEDDVFPTFIMDTIPEVPGNNFNELYDLIKAELEPWKERVKFHRVASLEVTEEMVPNDSLDSVFIDGDHRYDAVSKDLEFWWAKLRRGGQMLGDDYWMNDVRKAVLEFCEKHKVDLEFITNNSNNYSIFLLKKP